MDELRDFIVDGESAAFRPSGSISLENAVAMVASAIALARARKIRKLLVNTSGWIGLRSPSVTDRYFFVHEWARAADSKVQVAVVANPNLIDPDKFGVTVARNCGFFANVFRSEQDARAWLETDSRE